MIAEIAPTATGTARLNASSGTMATGNEDRGGDSGHKVERGDR